MVRMLVGGRPGFEGKRLWITALSRQAEHRPPRRDVGADEVHAGVALQRAGLLGDIRQN